ncbi:MAG: hypothetical protein U1F53_01920 [Burkholderiaceae bacterium]
MGKILYSRVLLWQDDILECLQLLKMGERCWDSFTSRTARDLPIDPDLQPAWLAMSEEENHRAGVQWENACPESLEFPSRSERSRVYAALEMLAIVTLYRVWVSGGQEKNVAAANEDPRMDALRERLVALAFPGAEERKEFNRLLKAVMLARHNAIAHTAAVSRDIKHFDSFVSYGGSSETLNTVDIDSLIPCVERLYEASRAILDEAGAMPD